MIELPVPEVSEHQAVISQICFDFDFLFTFRGAFEGELFFIAYLSNKSNSYACSLAVQSINQRDDEVAANYTYILYFK